MRLVIEQARRQATERRAEAEAAGRAYDLFLDQVAVPVFRQLAGALRTEGYYYAVATPHGRVRLVSERVPEDVIELVLDLTHHPPLVLGRTTRVLGRQIRTAERPIREGADLSTLTGDDVFEFLLTEIRDFVER